MITVVNPSDVSKYSFPSTNNHIVRDSVISTLEMYIETNQVVFVEGDEGFGKTSVLGILVQRNVSKCISLCIDPHLRYSYIEDAVFKDVYLQVKEFLGESVSSDIAVEKKDFQRLLSTLEYFLKKHRKKICFVVDGFDQVVDEDIDYVKSILDSLPIGLPNIEFVFSAKKGVLSKVINVSSKKTVSIGLFSLEEACRMLQGVPKEKVAQLISTFRPSPENLLTISRILSQGGSVDAILQENIESTEELYQEEWSKSINNIEKYSVVLCALAHAKKPLDRNDLENGFGLNDDDIRNIGEITFLVSNDEGIQFGSVGFLKFAAKKLEVFKSEAIKQLINITDRASDSDKNISLVTGYYNELGDSESVLSQLSNDNLELMLEDSRSINELLRQISIGIKNAEKNETELFRLCYLKSLLSGIKASGLLKSEMTSLLKKEDVKSALDLTRDASSNEERFQMLCLLASDYKEKEKPVPEHVEQQIDLLYKSIEPHILGVEKTLDIAMDLLAFDSERAMALINKVDDVNGAGENKSEYAFFKFTVQALQKNPDFFNGNLTQPENISAKKRHAIETVRLFKKGKPAAKILDGIRSIENPGEKIFVLRHWIKSFPDALGNELLLDYVLDLAVKTTEFSANATFYSDVLSCFPYLKDAKESAIIYKKILFQLPDIRRLGPTVNYVDVLLRLSEHEDKIGIIEHSADSILEYILKEIDDKSVLLAALCMMSSRVKKGSNCLYLIESKKQAIFDDVISGTAEQCGVLKEALAYEAEFDFVNAIKWAESLNTDYRRSEALCQVVTKYLDYIDNNDLNVDKLCGVIRRISIGHHRDECISALTGSLLNGAEVSKSEFKNLKKLAMRTKNLPSRCKFAASMLSFLSLKIINSPEQEAGLKEKLLSAWNGLDSDCQKIDHAFKISSYLTENCPEIADEYLERAITLRKQASISNESVLKAYVSSVDLQLRSFFFLVRAGAYEQQDLDILVDSVNSIPSVTTRARQFARLISVFQKNNKGEEASVLIQKYATPLLESLGREYNTFYAICVYHLLPVYFFNSPVSLDRIIEPIQHSDIYMHDAILSVCIEYMRKGGLVGDPFEPVKNHDYNVSYANIEKILNLIKKMKNDYSIYAGLRRISKDVLMTKKRGELTNSQLLAVVGEYSGFSGTLNPGHNGVQHDGYKICVRALTLGLGEDRQNDTWVSIVESARMIPNQSDRAFVLGTIAELAPANASRGWNFKKETFDLAFEAIDAIPSFLDKLSRLEDLAEKAKEFNKDFAKKCLRKAFSISAAEDSEERVNSRMSLIDSAYSIDEDFPDTLSAVYNDDPARKNLLEKNILRKRKREEDKRSFKPEESDISQHSHSDKYADMAWQLLGKLNASNHGPIKSARFYSYLKGVGCYDYEKMYPLLSYYLHLLGEKYLGRSNAQKYIKPVHEAIKVNTASFSKIYQFESGRRSANFIKTDTKTVLVDLGEREKAIDFMSTWLSGLQKYDLLIFDPYFSIDDLSFVASVINKDPDYKITVLTTLSQRNSWPYASSMDIADAVSDFWKDNVSTDAMPEIEILLAGAESLGWGLPIHDRWWLADDSGVSVGTSINGIGKRISQITVLDSNETAEIEQRLEGFVTKKQRVFNGRRVRYESVTV